MRASGASELRKCWLFYILKLLFPSICLFVLHILCLRNIFNFRCQITSAYIYNQCSFLLSLMVLIVLYIITTLYRQTLTLSKCMCMRASGVSELRQFWHFTFLNCLFLSIFGRYIRYFVGTNDMLVGLHVPTNLQMYRQFVKCTDKLRKSIIGGGGEFAPPPPPSGYANATAYLFIINSFTISELRCSVNIIESEM